MQLNTTKFGQIEIAEDNIFDFVEPVIGYDKLKKYVILQLDEESPFKWLQSVENGDVAFPITSPSLFKIDYNFEIKDEDAEKIGLATPETLITLNIVTIPANNPQDATINLLGPVIINSETKQGLQLILSDSQYSTRYKLFN